MATTNATAPISAYTQAAIAALVTPTLQLGWTTPTGPRAKRQATHVKPGMTVHTAVYVHGVSTLVTVQVAEVVRYGSHGMVVLNPATDAVRLPYSRLVTVTL
jgi:hypothetical protein